MFTMGVGVFVCFQIVAQNLVLACGRRWQPPGWLRFLGVTVIVATLFGMLQFAVDSKGFYGWVLPVTVWLLGWYCTWWFVLRAGWARVPASLISSGLHIAVLMGALDFVGSAGLWTWLVPVRVFEGWSLMYLPGAVAAHHCVPRPPTEVSRPKRIIALLAPAIAGLILLFLFDVFSRLVLSPL